MELQLRGNGSRNPWIVSWTCSMIQSVWLEIRRDDTGNRHIHCCTSGHEWFNPKPLKSRRFQLQNADETVQSFQTPCGLEFLARDSVVKFLAQTFNHFVARPSCFWIVADLFHVSSTALTEFYSLWKGSGDEPYSDENIFRSFHSRCATAMTTYSCDCIFLAKRIAETMSGERKRNQLCSRDRNGSFSSLSHFCG